MVKSRCDLKIETSYLKVFCIYILSIVGNCRASTESLNNGYTYTVPACIQECKELNVTNYCKCREFRYPGKFT